MCDLLGPKHCVLYLALCCVFLGKFFDVYEPPFLHPQIGAELHYQLLPLIAQCLLGARCMEDTVVTTMDKNPCP